MFTRTKIVCTIGPACDSAEKLEALILAGMNVARLNFSHGSHEEHGARIKLLKQVREKLDIPLAIMLDTKGPEIRLGKLLQDSLTLLPGQRIRLVKEELAGNASRITLRPPYVIDALKEGMTVLLDNGYIVTHVVKTDLESVEIEVDNGGVICSTKGVNVPGIDIDLPALTDQDRADICFGCAQDVDYIAASFIRTGEDVLAIKEILKTQNKPSIQVISKIENAKGVTNFESILQVSDGIMIARGDLGVEMPLSEVPQLQKKMIKETNANNSKPVVTATQMLESMIDNPRPTRAEVSDVANAVYDSTSAVMLSGETAIGAHPIAAVRMMRSIIHATELDFNYEEFFKRSTEKANLDVASAVAVASIKTAYSARAKAIFAFTTSGATAIALSRLRPNMPIIAMTRCYKVYHQLALAWGVIPLLDSEAKDINEAYKKISAYALKKKYVQSGDLVVITAGTPFGRAGTTNMMIVDSIGAPLI